MSIFIAYDEAGESFGRQFEDDFTRNAVVSGLTEEQAKSAFNQNMLSTGLLTDCPAQFVEEHGKRWMVSSYEAGDVVFHTPFTVCLGYSELVVTRLTKSSRFMHQRSIRTRIIRFALRQISGMWMLPNRMTRDGTTTIRSVMVSDV